MAECQTPDGATLSLYEHDGDYYICINGADLMSTRQFHSEQQLSEIGCAGLKEKKHARVLIGGLGMGYTLKSALACVGPDAHVTIAEFVPEIIEWNRDPRFPFAGSALADKRVTLVEGDVIRCLEGTATYDAILLDTDNGPTALTAASNTHLYTPDGIRKLCRAIEPAGCVAVWSVDAQPNFIRTLKKHGLQAKSHPVLAHATGGGTRFILVGRA